MDIYLNLRANSLNNSDKSGDRNTRGKVVQIQNSSANTSTVQVEINGKIQTFPNELNLKIGDEVLLRDGKLSLIPSNSNNVTNLGQANPAAYQLMLNKQLDQLNQLLKNLSLQPAMSQKIQMEIQTLLREMVQKLPKEVQQNLLKQLEGKIPANILKNMQNWVQGKTQEPTINLREQLAQWMQAQKASNQKLPLPEQLVPKLAEQIPQQNLLQSESAIKSAKGPWASLAREFISLPESKEHPQLKQILFQLGGEKVHIDMPPRQAAQLPALAILASQADLETTPLRTSASAAPAKLTKDFFLVYNSAQEIQIEPVKIKDSKGLLLHPQIVNLHPEGIALEGQKKSGPTQLNFLANPESGTMSAKEMLQWITQNQGLIPNAENRDTLQLLQNYQSPDQPLDLNRWATLLNQSIQQAQTTLPPGTSLQTADKQFLLHLLLNQLAGNPLDAAHLKPEDVEHIRQFREQGHFEIPEALRKDLAEKFPKGFFQSHQLQEWLRNEQEHAKDPRVQKLLQQIQSVQFEGESKQDDMRQVFWHQNHQIRSGQLKLIDERQSDESSTKGKTKRPGIQLRTTLPNLGPVELEFNPTGELEDRIQTGARLIVKDQNANSKPAYEANLDELNGNLAQIGYWIVEFHYLQQKKLTENEAPSQRPAQTGHSFDIQI